MHSSFTTKLLAAPERPFHEIILEVLNQNEDYGSSDLAVLLDCDKEEITYLVCWSVVVGCQIPDLAKLRISEALIGFLLGTNGRNWRLIILTLVRLGACQQLEQAVAEWPWQNEGEGKDIPVQYKGCHETLCNLDKVCCDDLDFITALPLDWQKMLLKINKKFNDDMWERALEDGEEPLLRTTKEWEKVLATL